MYNVEAPQQFDKSPRRVWSEFFQKYVIDYMPELKVMTPEEFKKEQEAAEKRAEKF